MKKIMIVVSTLIILLIIAVSCGNKPAKEGETAEKKAESKSDVVTPISHVNTQISFSGSSTLAPVISKISTSFIEKYVTWDKVDSSLPDENITIYVSAGGSGAGVKAVVDDVANFGMLARDIKDTEKEKIKDIQVFTLGMDALTVSVNPENKYIGLKGGNITKDEIIKIFSGEYKKWKDVDPSLPDEDIVVVTRDLSGGAHEVFQKQIMGEKTVREDAIQAPTMGALVAKIIENKNAIGYASFGITNQNTGKLIPLKVDNIEPTETNILNKSYYISRPLIIIKKGELTKTEKIFVNLLKSEEGKKSIKEMGFIPVSE